MDLPGCGAHLCLATLPPFPKMQRPPTWKAASGEPGAFRVFMSFFHFPLRSHPSPRLCRLQPPGSVFCISNLEGGKWHEILLAGVGEGLAGLFSLHRSPWPWDSMILKRNGARRPFRDPPASAGADCSVAWRVVGLPQQADLLAIFAVATHCTRVLQGHIPDQMDSGALLPLRLRILWVQANSQNAGLSYQFLHNSHPSLCRSDISPPPPMTAPGVISVALLKLAQYRGLEAGGLPFHPTLLRFGYLTSDYIVSLSILAVHLSPVTSRNVKLPGSRKLSPLILLFSNLLGLENQAMSSLAPCANEWVPRAGAQRGSKTGLCPPFGYSQPGCRG